MPVMVVSESEPPCIEQPEKPEEERRQPEVLVSFLLILATFGLRQLFGTLEAGGTFFHIFVSIAGIAGAAHLSSLPSRCWIGRFAVLVIVPLVAAGSVFYSPQALLPFLLASGVLYGAGVSLVKAEKGAAFLFLVFLVPLSFWCVYMARATFSGKVAQIIQADPNTVRALLILPRDEADPDSYPPLVANRMRIDDRAVIREVVSLLASSQVHSPNHPQPEWICLLGLDYGDHSAWCTVSSTKNNGVLIHISSGVMTGIVLSERRQDRLGPVLERIVSE